MSISKPALFASAATAQAVERARAVAILVGSYDGSGNYGDIAQFEAALALVERLGPGILALPVLEREYLSTHRELVEGSGLRAPHALFFDPDGAPEDDLVPVAAPVDLAFGASYLYGGGYLNHRWGARKLAMLGAAEALLAGGGAGAPYRVSTGLQVEAGWIAGADALPLGGFDLLGARDSESRQTLAGIGGTAPVLATGDDAIGLLGRPPSADAAATGDGRLHLNLHFAEHDWISERPGTVLEFYAGFLAELGRLADRPVLARPLIAYLDGRVDERVAIERLRAACSPLGIEIAEPLLLRPASLGEAASRLREASLTLTCSYHVALTSLMLQVPAVLIADNPYYAQKAAGLREGFELPPAFAPAAGVDPAAAAGEIAALLLDPARGGALRQGLAAAAERLRLRRATAEAELLGRLGSAAVLALEGRVEEQAERLRLRSAEPAALRARLAELEEEPPTGAAALEAELRAQHAEAALAGILQSRSWRLLAPLRRFRAWLRPH
ncbi:MAG: hypothetical protein QOI72_510 [Solirubrobacterales bacterium]|nr:hypothetical protein [Solirubrobacterales bacterium]